MMSSLDVQDTNQRRTHTAHRKTPFRLSKAARTLDVEDLHSVEDTHGDDVTPHDTSEDVDHHGLDLITAQQ